MADTTATETAAPAQSVNGRAPTPGDPGLTEEERADRYMGWLLLAAAGLLGYVALVRFGIVPEPFAAGARDAEG